MAEAYKILFLVIILKISAYVTANPNYDYCNLRSCPNPQLHTLCRYSSQTYGSECGARPVIGLSTSEKNYITEFHNIVRQRVASGNEFRGQNYPLPPAADMPDLVWNNELEEIAQAWANQCIDDHDQCRNLATIAGEYYVGQNLASVYTDRLDSSDIEIFLKGWYGESASVNNDLVNNFRSGYWGHYTQMIWAETTAIGCAQIKFIPRTPIVAPIAIPGGQTQYGHLLVCNYGPGGNHPNQKIYQARYSRG